MHHTTAIIPAAGLGKRMGASIPKQLLALNERPVLFWTLSFFQQMSLVDDIILVVEADRVDAIKKDYIVNYGFAKIAQVVAGGKERQDSVYNGIIHCRDESDVILVHDGVRPFPPATGVAEAIASARDGYGGVLGIPASDTLKTVNTEMQVTTTLDRREIYQIQTPQVFPAEQMKMAYARARRDGFVGTDEASVMEMAGFPVKIFPGNKFNIKLTTPEDLVIAGAILKNMEAK
jgi:2-C-methyl-D-erythritol 4-phosphate cytidylyltransferase